MSSSHHDRTTCDIEGCELRCAWRPVLLFRPPLSLEPAEPAKAYVGLRICEHHRRILRLNDFDPVAACKGFLKEWKVRTGEDLQVPDLDRTELEWEPL